MHKYTNHLINETSPYLLQHAHNPVDWYPWGAEAFEKARVVLLNPLIQNGLIMIENKGVICFAQFRRRSEGGYRFGGAFLPIPQPDRVEVRIANQMDAAWSHSKVLFPM